MQQPKYLITEGIQVINRLTALNWNLRPGRHSSRSSAAPGFA